MVALRLLYLDRLPKLEHPRPEGCGWVRVECGRPGMDRPARAADQACVAAVPAPASRPVFVELPPVTLASPSLVSEIASSVSLRPMQSLMNLVERLNAGGPLYMCA